MLKHHTLRTNSFPPLFRFFSLLGDERKRGREGDEGGREGEGERGRGGGKEGGGSEREGERSEKNGEEDENSSPNALKLGLSNSSKSR